MSTATQVRERPIVFPAPMIRAILEGRKMQTRRIIKPQPEHGVEMCAWSGTGWAKTRENDGGCSCLPVTCPFGEHGDRLWCKETWRPFTLTASPGCAIDYRATQVDRSDIPWRSSIHMSRWASRITLEVTGVRVERVESCTTEDAISEGFASWAEFLDEFYRTNAGRVSVLDNPWVWCIEFRRCDP